MLGAVVVGLLWTVSAPLGRVAPSGESPVEATPEAARQAPVDGPKHVAAEGAEGRVVVAKEEHKEEHEVLPEPAPRGRFHGRVVASDGGPFVGADVLLRGWQARGKPTPAGKAWEDITAETDAEGRFDLRFDPPPHFTVRLELSAPGFMRLDRRFVEPAPDVQHDFGTLTLRPAAVLEVHIEDPNGVPMPGVWSVVVEGVHADPSGDSVWRTKHGDPRVAPLVIDALPAGEVRLRARNDLAGDVSGPEVELVEGERHVVRIVCEDAGLAQRVTLGLFGRPFDAALRDLDVLHLEGPGGVIEGRRIPQRTNDFSFEGVPPGLHTLTIQDPRFEAYTRGDIQAGQSYDVWLRPAARIVLELTGTGLEPSERPTCLVELHYPREQLQRQSVVQLFDGPLSEDGLLPPALPGDPELVVAVPGFRTARLQLLGLVAGETRVVELVLEAPARLQGQVVDARGKGVPEAHVILMEVGADPEGIHAAWHPVNAVDRAVLELRADREGRFVVADAPVGSFDLYGFADGWSVAGPSTVELVLGRTVERNIVLPVRGGLRVRTPVGWSAPAGWGLVFVSESSPKIRSRRVYWDDVFVAELNPTAPGEWRGEGLPLGRGFVRLQREDRRVPAGAGGWREMRPAEFELAEVELLPGREVVVDVDPSGMAFAGLDVSVALDGRAFHGASVTALAPGPDPKRFEVKAGSGTTDGLGWCALDDLLPGPLQVQVEASKADFVVVREVDIAVGGRRSMELDFQTEVHSVRFVDSQGQSVGSGRVQLKGPAGVRAALLVAEDGSVQARLPRGRYSVDFRESLPAGFSADSGPITLKTFAGELPWPPPQAEVWLNEAGL